MMDYVKHLGGGRGILRNKYLELGADHFLDWFMRYRRLECNETLQLMLSHSTKEQQTLALILLAELPKERTELLESRVATLSVGRFSGVVNALEGLPDSVLLQYLELCTLLSFKSHVSPYTQKFQETELRKYEEKNEMTEVTLQPPFLPPELTQLVWEKFYEAVFIPGEIVLYSFFSDGEDFFFDTSSYLYHNLEKLRLLDSRLYNEYKEHYWSDNSFVSRSF